MPVLSVAVSCSSASTGDDLAWRNWDVQNVLDHYRKCWATCGWSSFDSSAEAGTGSKKLLKTPTHCPSLAFVYYRGDTWCLLPGEVWMRDYQLIVENRQ